MSMSSNGSVLILGNFLSANVGNHCVCEDLARKLESAGMQVFTASDRRARIPRLLDMVGTIWRRRRDYSSASVDVYSGLGFGLAEAACLALRAAGKPYVLTLRGGNLPNYGKRWPRRVRRLLENAAVVTTPSEYLKEHMLPYRSNIQLLPNPLQLSRYPFRLRNEPSPKLVWIRSFHNLYNPSMAIDVVDELQGEFPDIQLTMVGPDKGDGSLQSTEQLISERGLTNRITITGGIPKAQIPERLDRADIFINTTNIDNTPVSVMESMACGLCVVSTDVGGMPHLVDHNESALLVPPRDPKAMADAIRRVLKEEGLASRLSGNANAFAEQFDWPAILPKWVSLFEEVSGE